MSLTLDGAAIEGDSREGEGEMDGLTGSEIAGFVVGGLLLGATIAAPKVDGFIASSQRRSPSLPISPLLPFVSLAPIVSFSILMKKDSCTVSYCLL